MKFVRGLKSVNRIDSKEIGQWKDVALIFSTCLMSTVVGVMAGRYAMEAYANNMIAREGPIGAGDIRLPIAFYVCQFFGGLLGPFVTYFVRTDTPQPVAKAFVSVSFITTVTALLWAGALDY